MVVGFSRPRSYSLGSEGKDDAVELCRPPCKHHPITSKYPNGITAHHIPELEDFINELSSGLSKLSFPRREEPYLNVHVLLLSWEEDDINTLSEITTLEEVFKTTYNFATERYSIPSKNPFNELEEKLVVTRNQQDRSENNLLIIYYGGHGELDKQNRSIWKAWKSPPRGAGGWSPSLDWTELQLRMQTSKADVLFIIDCCYASSMVRGQLRGTKELLAACGRGDKAIASSENSFTKAVIQELKGLQGRPCGIPILHQLLLRNQAQHNLKPTPIYACLSEDRPSIVLSPVARTGATPPLDTSSSPANQSSSTSSGSSTQVSRSSSTTSLDSVLTAMDCRVLISVSLANPDKKPIAAEWINWFKSYAPRDVGGVKVKLDRCVNLESAWDSNSTFLLVSLPVWLWDVIPPNPALSFLTVISSRIAVKRAVNGKSVRERYTVIMKSYLESGVKKASSDAPSNAEKYHEEIVQLLLDEGAELDLKCENGRSPLSYVAEMGYKKTVQWLLDEGAELDSRDEMGRTPLSYATAMGNEEIAGLLLRSGAKPEFIDENGRSPLSYAAEMNCKTVARWLIDNGADLDSRDEKGRTPLSYATAMGNEEIAGLLLRSGAKPESRDENGRFQRKVLVSMAFGEAERSDSTERISHSDKLLQPDPEMDEETCLSLAEFQALVGTNSNMLKIRRDQEKQPWIWKWLKRDHLESQDRERLYPKVLREEKTVLRQLYIFDILVCTCLILQPGIASAIVILSTLEGDKNIIVTILGAVIAIITGILSLAKGQGQSVQLIYADSLRKIRDNIEFCESGLQSGVTSVKYKQVLDVWSSYTSERDSQMAFGEAERSDLTECISHSDKMLQPDPEMDEETCLSLAEFQALVGTNSNMLKIRRDQEEQPWIWKWLKRDHLESQDKKKLYPKILREEKKVLQQLYIFKILVDICLIFQLGMASAMVILSVLERDNNIIVAILGAVTALIAGILSLAKGQGQPMRLINYADSLRKIRDNIEFCEIGLNLGVTSVKYKQVLDVWSSYTSARDSQMKNHPDVWSP